MIFIRGLSMYKISRTHKRRLIALGIALLTCVNFLLYGTDLHTSLRSARETTREVTVCDKKPAEVVFLFILCAGNAKQETDARSTVRQLNHAETLIKSATALTATKLRFIVVAESEKLYGELKSRLDLWPNGYRRRVTLQYFALAYPDSRKDMKNMFRPCATERLFLPSMLLNEDAAIYIDTDFLFMRPPEDLWVKFLSFNSTHLSAMTPCLIRYGVPATKTVPYYGSDGLNAGLMLMNFTRMRQFSPGWENEILHGYDMYKENVTQSDQDILNIFFSRYPELMFELGCEWNYRMFQCMGSNKCPITDTEGASLLHGNARSFVSADKENRMKAIYDCWMEHKLGTPLRDLYKKMSLRLRQVDEDDLPVKCHLSNIDSVLTQKLADVISGVNKHC